MLLRKKECLLCCSSSPPLLCFPKHPKRMRTWLERIKKEELLSEHTEAYIYNNGRLCTVHFSEAAFSSSLKQKLTRDAQPIDLRGEAQFANLNFSLCNHSTPVTQSVTCDIQPQDSLIRTPKTREISRLRCKVSKMKKSLFEKDNDKEKEKKKKHGYLLNKLNDMLNARQYQFVLSQIRANETKANGRRWSSKDKAFAMNIYYQSPAAYRILRKNLAFPCKATLQRSTGNIAKSDGFCPIVFAALTEKVKTMKESEKVCILAFDEMSLKEELNYNAKLDIIDGFESARTDESRQLANEALVFMLRSVTSNWKQVVAYYFRGNTMPSGWFKSILLSVINKVSSCGLTVIATVCDQGPHNNSLLKSLGVTCENPCFKVDGKEVFALYDPPHLIKSVRNNLKNYDVKYISSKNNEVQVASWKDIEEFYQRECSEKYRTAPNLTYKHIHGTKMSNMSVKLATQVFSHSVAAGLAVYHKTGMSVTALSTADFVGKMNKLFDTMNSKNLHGKTKYASALSATSCHIKKWMKWKTWIKSWKFVDSENKVRTPICKKGLILTLNATEEILKRVQKKEISYILTNRLNQDCLENTFSSVRRRGGFRDNPSTLDFRRAIRNVMVFSFMKKSHSTNCEDDSDVNLLNFATKTVASEVFLCDEDENNELVIDLDVHEVPTISDIERNVIAYISGVILRSFKKKSPCEGCEKLLVGEKILDAHTFMLYFKEFKESPHGLNWPTYAFYQYMLHLSECFYQNLNFYFKKCDVKKNLSAVLQKINFDFFDHEHKNEVQHFVISAFLTMMIKHEVRKRNGGCQSRGNAKRLKHVMHK